MKRSSSFSARLPKALPTSPRNQHGLQQEDSNSSDFDEDIFFSILCHILTHADIHVLMTIDGYDTQLVAKPSFSKYKPLLEGLNEALLDTEVSTMQYFSRKSGGIDVPVGIILQQPIQLGVLNDWKVRSKDWAQFSHLEEQSKSINVWITAVVFPLISVLIPDWIRTSEGRFFSRNAQFLYIISGSGVPNSKGHKAVCNSTSSLAKLMTNFFLRKFYPDIVVCHIDSGPGIFSFHQNVQFINQEVRTAIAKKRMEAAKMFGEHWTDWFHMMITLMDGPAARIQALNACLREFRPDYLYLSHNKTFWHRFPDISELWDEEIEILEFSTAEMTPAVSVSSLDAYKKLLVFEMISYLQQFEEAVHHNLRLVEMSSARAVATVPNELNQESELRSFWLRKTRKPVLSVLMTQRANEDPKFFRGMNMEVSMPTGSLCAERSAISNALSSNPILRREDMKMIAVLSASLDPQDYVDDSKVDSDEQSIEDAELKLVLTPIRGTVTPGKASNPILPCGACQEWLKKIAISNPDFKVLTFENMRCSEIYVQSV